MAQNEDTTPDSGGQGRHSDERYVRHEEEEAALEAAEIGGEQPEYEGDEADRAVEEGGGGVAEASRRPGGELIEAASHGEHRYNPAEDEFTPEVESTISRPSTARPTTEPADQ